MLSFGSYTLLWIYGIIYKLIFNKMHFLLMIDNNLEVFGYSSQKKFIKATVTAINPKRRKWND